MSATFWCGTRIRGVVAMLTVFVLVRTGDAQTTNDPVADARVSVSEVTPATFGLGDRVTVEIGGSDRALQHATSDLKRLVLLLNGVPLQGLCTDAVIVSASGIATNAAVTSSAANVRTAVVTNGGVARIDFALERKDANRAEWTSLLGSPRSMLRPINVEIGIEANNAVTILARATNSYRLAVLPNEPFYASHTTERNLSGFVAIVAGFALLLRWAVCRSLAALLEGWVWLGWAAVIVGIYACLGPTRCWTAFFTLFLVGFIYLARRTEMIRDSGPQPPKDKLRPYSLARTQMAIWFFLSISAFVFIWLMTNALDSITGTVLALMGIGAGTALGAEAQEAGKVNKLQDEKQKLEAKPDRSDEERKRLKELQRLLLDVPALEAERTNLNRLKEVGDGLAKLPSTPALEQLEQRSRLESEQQKLQAEVGSVGPPEGRIKEIDDLLASRPVSQGFFEDILTDDVGISFHRFQMFVWTFVLGIIFIASVYRQLAMPEFNDTLLALMGISSGTYMGFMIAEPKK